jgi:acyl-CoA synthetase (AMP-forming)/AMP-acid ligase II
MQKTHITDYLEHYAGAIPDKLALVADRRSLTWKELQEEVESRAGYFSKRLGNEEQQLVGLLMDNDWELVVSYLAILKSGHIAMPIDVIYKQLEIEAIIKQMKPRLVVADGKNHSRLDTPMLVAFDEIETSVHSDDYLRIDAKDQIASLMFTSGTTGKPKAAPYTHSNHIWNIVVCSKAWGWNHDDTMLLSLRLAHWYGICMGLSGAIYHGNTLYLEEGFDPSRTLQRLSRGDISLFTHTPIAYARMLEVEGDFDLSGVRLPVSGSAALAPSLWQAFRDRFGLEIIESYGSSETGRIASNSGDERRAGTPGKPLSEVEIKLGDQDELLVRSPGLFPGYYKNPAATASQMSPDGYWKTGDIAELSEDGRIYLKGRVQERIRKQGYTLSPRDIEWALRENPKIQDCLVIGLHGKDSDNDKLVYFIVGQLSPEDVRNYTKQNLPSIWRPDQIIFIENILRRPNGKPDLVKLKSLVP